MIFFVQKHFSRIMVVEEKRNYPLNIDLLIRILHNIQSGQNSNHKYPTYTKFKFQKLTYIGQCQNKVKGKKKKNY